MNPAKSELFFGGYNDLQRAVLSDISGFKLGTWNFPNSLPWFAFEPKADHFRYTSAFCGKSNHPA